MILKLQPITALALVVLLLAWAPEALAQTSSQNINSDFSIVQGQEAENHFWTLHSRLKGFAVVILLIMVVIAGIMASFQRTGMAIMVAVGGVILFGGYYVILLIYQGLS